jgi:hypothetical protein
LDIEKPNLVVLSGDAVSGNQNIDFDRIWTVLTEPMKKRGIPWAYVNGNHDVEGKLNGSQIVELDQRIGGLTRHGPPGTTGASNYVISINSMNNEDLVANIYFFDSMRLGCYVNNGYGCVHIDTINWYRETSKMFRTRFGKVIPSIGFLHIPIQEIMDVWNTRDCYGVKAEPTCCSVVNTGLFAAMLEQGDIKALFCGHDHKNDYHGFMSDIMLGYGRKTGYGGYDSGKLMRGARVFEMTMSPYNITTWIRQEDGSIGNLPLHKPDPKDLQHQCR